MPIPATTCLGPADLGRFFKKSAARADGGWLAAYEEQPLTELKVVHSWVGGGLRESPW